MGRELKRVDINNPPPLNVPWAGYRNPFEGHTKKCPSCGGKGYSPRANLYSEQWYGAAKFDPVAYGAVPLKITDEALRESVKHKIEISLQQSKKTGQRYWYTNGGLFSFAEAVKREVARMFDLCKGKWCHHLIQDDVDALIAKNRLWDFTHDWDHEKGWTPKQGEIVVTAEQVNRWSFFGFGHDSLNSGICVAARCDREGVVVQCGTCDGNGVYWPDPSMKKRYDEWQPTEPPAGEAYQIWETVSDGSPISPAFERPEDLARWMVENDSDDCDFGTWMRFIDVGWSPSMVSDDRGNVTSGVKFVGNHTV